jgi:hypothetical protein
MPIGKARDLLRTRRPKPVERDPASLEAYEEGWYALLARQASGHEAVGDRDDEPAASEGVEDPEAAPLVEESHLAKVTALVVPRPEPAPAAPVPQEPPGPDEEAARAKKLERARRAEPSRIRIGVRPLEEPGSVYLAYLTSSPHRHYFRGEWWPASPSISPSHLWRANHLGAGWDIDDVERFMATAAGRADELIASAPRWAPVGSPERREWVARYLSAGWVREFGLSRVSKTLHAVLPELVADLDPAMMPWARGAWLGVRGRADPADPDMWAEICELLEDVLVLRAQPLGQIVQRLRSLAPGLAPNGRLGIVMAAFWESYWREAPTARGAARRSVARSKRAALGGRRRAAGGSQTQAPVPGEAAPSAEANRKPRSTPRRRAGDAGGRADAGS